MVINYLILLLFLLNFKKSSELNIQTVDPIYIQAQVIGEETLTLTFDESVENDNFDLIFVFVNDETEIFNFKRKRDPKTKNLIYQADFTIEYDKFIKDNLYGFYKIYYGDIQNGITIDTRILIYSEQINFRNPINRYYLVGNEKIDCSFDFRDPIIREEIYRISLDDGEEIKDNCTYSLEENGKSLRISIDKSPTIKTYIFSVYPTYDSGTTSPLCLSNI